jgi:monoterpene epsilon-lactone hydrolase
MSISIQARFTKKLLRPYFSWLLRHSYQKQRQTQDNFQRRTAIIPKDISFEPAAADGVPAVWVASPESAADRVILYFHGGAYFAGSITTHRDFSAHLVKATGWRLLLVDYRLAPENPYPAALEDALTAYRWLLTQGFDPARMVIAGDSAGGGLTLTTMVALRDAGDPLPRAAVCFSPWTDLTSSGDSMERNAAIELMCKPEMLKQSAQWYAGDHDLRSPQISPLFADLRGLPPLQIHVGTEETLLDDSTRVAARAKEAGVDVHLEIWPGMFHVFPLVSYLPEAQKALQMVAEFLDQKITT